MLFKCKDTYFFSNKERFLIFFCNFAAKLMVIAQMAKGKLLFGEEKSLKGKLSQSEQERFPFLYLNI